MSKQRKMSEVLYERYEYLAKKYASKIFLYEELSYEYEDLVQEFKLKIFTSIKAYGRRCLKYRRGEAAKPVPIRYYLEAACSNKSRDFMKYISKENHKLRIDDINYDFGTANDSKIDTNHNKFIVHGINLLEGLRGKERAIFSLYLRGYNMNFLNRVYFSSSKEKAQKKAVIADGDEPFGAADIIELQKTFLIKKYGNELRQANHIFETYSFDD
jgi:DNA-directed RNA polymerase specialized sigma24 family protein